MAETSFEKLGVKVREQRGGENLLPCAQYGNYRFVSDAAQHWTLKSLPAGPKSMFIDQLDKQYPINYCQQC